MVLCVRRMSQDLKRSQAWVPGTQLCLPWSWGPGESSGCLSDAGNGELQCLENKHFSSKGGLKTQDLPKSLDYKGPEDSCICPREEDEGSPTSKSGLNLGLPPALPRGSMELDVTGSREIKFHMSSDAQGRGTNSHPPQPPPMYRLSFPRYRSLHTAILTHRDTTTPQVPTPKPSGAPGASCHPSTQASVPPRGAPEKIPADFSGLPQLTKYLEREIRDCPPFPTTFWQNFWRDYTPFCGSKEKLSRPQGH